MKTAPSTEPGLAGGSGSRPTVVGQEPNPPASKGTHFAWLLAGASIAVIVVIYFFAFRAAHEAQIKDVPLAPRGAKP